MKLSIILPTYNNEKTLGECLNSLTKQNFPKNKYEILVIDGGSSDKTIEIARKFRTKIIKNPLKNEENARIIGIRKAKGELLCFIDADNIVVGKDWLKRMAEPFEDAKISFADTLFYGYRKNDGTGVRYQALIGGDDPLIMYLGRYSRWCYLKDDWTDCPHWDEDNGDYIKSQFCDGNKIPPMGSNGFLVRAKIARKFVKNSFIHSDFVYDAVNSGYNCFTKVKTSIIHNQPRFFPNKIRRIERRMKKEVRIKYDYGITKWEIAKTAAYVCLILPVLYDTIKGMIKKPDSAWLFHPAACFGEVFLYGFYAIKSKIK